MKLSNASVFGFVSCLNPSAGASDPSSDAVQSEGMRGSLLAADAGRCRRPPRVANHGLARARKERGPTRVTVSRRLGREAARETRRHGAPRASVLAPLAHHGSVPPTACATGGGKALPDLPVAGGLLPPRISSRCREALKTGHHLDREPGPPVEGEVAPRRCVGDPVTVNAELVPLTLGTGRAEVRTLRASSSRRPLLGRYWRPHAPTQKRQATQQKPSC